VDINTTEVVPSAPFADDFLRGVRLIAEFIDEPERRTYYLLESGYLPAGKLGNVWLASKRRLRAHYERLTQGAEPQAQPRRIRLPPKRSLRRGRRGSGAGEMAERA
jgi:hypothetical protein